LNFIRVSGALNQIWPSDQKRIEYAQDILQKEMLPHTGIIFIKRRRFIFWVTWRIDYY
jgi:hypothetical protein